MRTDLIFNNKNFDTFLELTFFPQNMPFSVTVSKIAAIIPHPERTDLILDSGIFIKVKENREEILERIEHAYNRHILGGVMKDNGK